MLNDYSCRTNEPSILLPIERGKFKGENISTEVDVDAGPGPGAGLNS